MDIPDSSTEYQTPVPDTTVSAESVTAPFQLSDEERKRAKMMMQLQGAQQFFVTISRGLLKILEDLSSHLLKR